MLRLRRPELYAALLVNSGWVVACLLLGGTALWAQGPTGAALRVTAIGEGGVPIRQTAIRLEELEQGVGWTGQTGADGSVAWTQLPPGEYVVQLPAVASYKVTLALGGLAEVTVRMHALGTDAVWTARGSEDAGQPDALPDQDDDGLVSARGLASTQNSVVMDGVDGNQSLGSVPVGTGSEPVENPEDDARGTAGFGSVGLARGRSAGAPSSFAGSAVREFRVGSTYSALTGHAGGNVMTVVSRSGGAELHGSADYGLRSSVLAATDPLSIATSYSNGVVTAWSPKPRDLRQNFGVTVGGPAFPRRLRHVFYFYAFEQQLRDFPAVSSPTYAQFFRLTATQTALLGTRGVSAAATNHALNYIDSLTGTAPRSSSESIHFAKIDWHATPRQTLAIQYNRVRWDRPAGAVNAPIVARGRASLGDSLGSLDSLVPRVTMRIAAHLVNELRVQASRDLQYERPQANLPQEPGIGPGGQAPEVAIAPDGFLFGTPASLSQVAYPDERRYQLADTLAWVRGRHLVQVGGDVSWVHDRVATLPNQEGTFRYDSSLVSGHAGGLVDWITDYTFNAEAYPNEACPRIGAAIHLFCFNSYTQSFGVQNIAFNTSEWAGFVQDHWRVSKALTVEAGLRYEYELLPFPQQPNLSLDAVFGATGATSVFPEDRKNLGPRVAIAWQPSSGFVVRLGYGEFFGRLPGTTIRSALANTAVAGSTTHVRITPATVTACPQVANQGFGYGCSYLTEPPAAVATTSSAMVFDRRFRLPTIQQASLMIEREWRAGFRLSASYLLNMDRQLQGSTDINIVPSTAQETFQLQGGTGAVGVQNGEEFVVPVYTQRLSTLFGPVTDIRSQVNGSYNGLTVTGEHRVRRGFGLRATYTRSKAIDYGQSEGGTPPTNAQFDPETVGYDKGLSSLNYPQSLHVTETWEPRLTTTRHWLREAANGWELEPIAVAHSGRPYTYQIFGGTALKGGRDTINGSGGAVYLPTVGRNTLRLPGSFTGDLRVSRSFGLGTADRMHLRAAVEVFNVTNHQNVSSVEQRAFLVGVPGATTVGVTPLIYQDAPTIASEGLNTPAFGTPTAASTSLLRARQVQISLRLSF